MKSVIRLSLFALCAVLLITGGILIGRGLSNIEGPKGQLVETTEEVVVVATATAMPTFAPTATDEPTTAPTVELTATAEPTATMVPTEAPTATAEPMATATFEATEEVAEEVVEEATPTAVPTDLPKAEVEVLEVEEIDIEEKIETSVVAFPQLADEEGFAHVWFVGRSEVLTSTAEGVGELPEHQGKKGGMIGKVSHSFMPRSFKDAYKLMEISYVIYEKDISIFDIIEDITVLSEDEDALCIRVQECFEEPVIAKIWLNPDDMDHYWSIVRNNEDELIIPIRTSKDACKPTATPPVVSGGSGGGTTVSTETPTEEPTQEPATEPETEVTPSPEYDPVVLPEETGEPNPQYDEVYLPEFQEEETDYVPDNPEILGWDYQTEEVPAQQYDPVDLSPVVEGEIPQDNNIGDTTEVLAWGDESSSTSTSSSSSTDSGTYIGSGYYSGTGYYGSGYDSYDYSGYGYGSYGYGSGYDYYGGYGSGYDYYGGYGSGYDYGSYGGYSGGYDSGGYSGGGNSSPSPSYDSPVLPWG